MRPQTLLIGVLALVFGVSAAVGVNTYVKSRNVGAGPAAETVTVVVAAIDVSRGDTISADLVTTRDYPKAMVPDGALTTVEEAIDRAVAIPLIKGEAVLDAKLSPKGAGRGLAALVPKGMRAVTIQTPNVASGVAGFVMPGNKVDVVLTVTSNGGNDETGGGSTTTLLQRIEILAVDQRIDAPADNKMDVKELRSVTLLVTPRQANLLDLGQNKGTLHLALRNPDDDRDAGTTPVFLKDLRFTAEKPWDERLKSVLDSLAKARAARPAPEPAKAPEPVVAQAPKPPAPIQIRTIRGASEGSVLFHPLTPPPARVGLR